MSSKPVCTVGFSTDPGGDCVEGEHAIPAAAALCPRACARYTSHSICGISHRARTAGAELGEEPSPLPWAYAHRLAFERGRSHRSRRAHQSSSSDNISHWPCACSGGATSATYRVRCPSPHPDGRRRLRQIPAGGRSRRLSAGGVSRRHLERRPGGQARVRRQPSRAYGDACSV